MAARLRPAQAAGAQPVEYRALHRRQQQRHRRRSGGGADPRRDRHRYRRLDPRSGGACGIAGIKPTYGLVSRAGVAPAAFSLDHIGPMAWTAEDCALMLQALAGHDPRDPASASRPVPNYTAQLGSGIKGLKIGVIHHFHETDHKVSDGTQTRHYCSDRHVARARRRDPRGPIVAVAGLAGLRLVDLDHRTCGGLRGMGAHPARRFQRRLRSRLMLGALCHGRRLRASGAAAARASRRAEAAIGARCHTNRRPSRRGGENRRRAEMGRVRPAGTLRSRSMSPAIRRSSMLPGFRRTRSAGGDPTGRQAVPGARRSSTSPTPSRRPDPFPRGPARPSCGPDKNAQIPWGTESSTLSIWHVSRPIKH